MYSGMRGRPELPWNYPLTVRLPTGSLVGGISINSIVNSLNRSAIRQKKLPKNIHRARAEADVEKSGKARSRTASILSVT